MACGIRGLRARSAARAARINEIRNAPASITL
jgi:hypothetical protein